MRHTHRGGGRDWRCTIRRCHWRQATGAVTWLVHVRPRTRGLLLRQLRINIYCNNVDALLCDDTRGRALRCTHTTARTRGLHYTAPTHLPHA